ncbi:carbohydrate-binding protein [Chengkuizengella axinellae]|uniref:Carbohydrate-binding protein n=1 Tax=Chengkuizengella axinellae TaxID=3064388 RepID=A0ABT9J2U4_9BACL|nr:carbohydrate-binding protein [Chengkuizengella sp. 2205SS18-9]MDP5275922.1 carbohydrate-binding protein [Chengkuizengella sp. 2205SS18-9]
MFNQKNKKTRSFTMLSLAFILIFTSVSMSTSMASGETVEVWVTTPDQQKLLEKDSNLQFSSDTTAADIHVDENIEYQEMDGFGAAVSGSSAYLLNQKIDSTQRENILKDLFGKDGIGLSFVRQTIGASDFNRSSYTYNDMPEGETDPNLDQFSIQKDKENIIPILQEIDSVNPDLKILGTPWSAPAWMKESGTLNGGSLSPDHYQTYADYFVKYIEAYENEGLPIYAITVQNEPHHETNSYPSMYMSAEQQVEFVKNYLGPTFESQSVNTDIIAWDHNWDEFEYPIQVLNDEEANAYLAGSAFHCYAGSPEAQTAVHNAYPDKGIWFTECSGGEWATEFGGNLKWNMENIVIGATRNWAKSVLLWNLALDENFGPTNGGCSDCRGVVTVNSETGEVVKNVEYYVLGHVSKFVKPGANRIESNVNSDVQNVAFKNPDGSKVLLAMNNTEAEKEFKVRWGEQSFAYTLPAGAVATFVWSGEQVGDSGNFELNPFEQVEAENFSDMSGVQTESANDAGGGLVVGHTDDGDYLVFNNMNFENGAESVEVRVATEAVGGQIEFRLGSPTGTLISTVDVPNTGGWQSWVTNSASVSSVEGVHDLYVVFASENGGIGNFNWFKFNETIPEETEISAFERIEVENYDVLYGIQTESANDAGGGLNVGHTDDGDYIGFNNVNFENGAVSVDARVSTDSDGGVLEFRLDSTDGTLISTLEVTKTGGWQSWVTKSADVSNVEGTHDLYIVFKSDTGGIGNLNWVTFHKTDIEQPEINAFEKIEVENYNTQYGVQTENTSDEGGGLNVGHTDNGDYIGFNNVNFENGAVGVDVRAATDSEGGTLEFRVDNPTGAIIGTVEITNTGGWQTWVTETAEISNVTGVHDLYVVFQNGSGGIGNINWIKFFDTADVIKGELEQFKAEDKTAQEISEQIINEVVLGVVDPNKINMLLQDVFLEGVTDQETEIHVNNIADHIERDLNRMLEDLNKANKDFDQNQYVKLVEKELEKLLKKT